MNDYRMETTTWPVVPMQGIITQSRCNGMSVRDQRLFTPTSILNSIFASLRTGKSQKESEREETANEAVLQSMLRHREREEKEIPMRERERETG